MKKVFAIFTALLFFGACFTFTGCKQDTDVTNEKKTVVTEAIEVPEITKEKKEKKEKKPVVSEVTESTEE